MSTEPRSSAAFDLSPDFAEQVLRQVDRVRQRRRRWTGAAASLIVVVAVLVVGRSPTSSRGLAHRAGSLAESDFTWLESAGSEPSDAEAMLFPDASDAEAGSEGNPLIVVAENL